MREKKFKAWDIKNKMFLTGMDLEIYIGMSSKFTPSAFRFMAKNPMGLPEETILLGYIGAKDKANNEIYEGDIYNDDVTGNRVIIYDNRNARFVSRRWQKDISFFPNWEIIEVIGNIYPNPELLKEAK